MLAFGEIDPRDNVDVVLKQAEKRPRRGRNDIVIDEKDVARPWLHRQDLNDDLVASYANLKPLFDDPGHLGVHRQGEILVCESPPHRNCAECGDANRD